MYPDAPAFSTRLANWSSGMHAQEQHRDFRPQFLEVLEDVETAATRHCHVQNHEVPSLLPDEVKDLAGVLSFATYDLLKFAD